MCLELLVDSRFLSLLLQIDRDLAALRRAQRCSFCDGPLHAAPFARKPRGLRGEPPEDFALRFSFCCGREGCRRRATPPSVRFLGPKVYLAVTIVLVSTLRHGPTPRRYAALHDALGVERATVARWRAWWVERFVPSPFWRSLRGRLALALEPTAIPAGWLALFAGTLAEQLVGLLRQLAPITTRPGLLSHAR